jgi:hypothetical protein
MNRLVAFGCSYTYGQGMEDCFITNTKPGPNPSKYAWPNVLAKLLDKQCVNLSVPGCSNKRIWYEIVNTEFEKEDTVIICWTHNERHMKIDDIEHVDIGPWQFTDEAVSYYKFLQTNSDSNYDINVRMSHTDYHLDRLGIRHYNCIAIDDEFERLNFNKTELLNTSFHELRHNYGKAKDGLHPDRHAHNAYANELYKEITECV